MILQPKSLEKLRLLINEETEYRTGPKLVEFFNQLGSNDRYGQGFPSRWAYTDQKLSEMNGKPELDKCVKKVFAPVNFISRFKELDGHIADFNKYLAFDGLKVVRKGTEITFTKPDPMDFDYQEQDATSDEESFLNKEFKQLKINKLGLSDSFERVIQLRIDEMRNCLKSRSPLAFIFLCGSTLEGLLLDLACKNPKVFNSSRFSPKDKGGKVFPIHEWRLGILIDTATDVGFLGQDVKKFSHALRDFRNYIHPNQQVLSRFDPDQHTAKICWQVFHAVIADLSKLGK